MSGFKEGELVLACTPYAYVLHDEFRNQYCDFCFKENNQLIKCTRCSFTYYCDKNCQTKAWEMHQTECKYLKNCVGEKPDAATRACALIILKIKKHGVDEPFDNVGDRKMSFATLMSHVEDIKQDPKMKNNVEQLSVRLREYIGPENTPSFDDLTEIIGKFKTNSFSILEMASADCIGMGLYLGASVFDHSCDPDALVVFDGTTLYVRMRRDVSHRIASKVRITYIDIFLQLTEERRMSLYEKYYFHCECEVCISSLNDDLMTKLVSNTEEAKLKAFACQEEFKKKEQTLRKWSKQTPELALEECNELLKAQSKVLADSNIYKLKTLRIALDACFQMNVTQNVSQMATCLEKYLKLYHGNVHPELAAFLYDYGEHLHMSGNKEECKSKMLEFDNILKIIFGEEHPHYKTMKNSINPYLHT